jgi:hypothetical protein
MPRKNRSKNPFVFPGPLAQDAAMVVYKNQTAAAARQAQRRPARRQKKRASDPSFSTALLATAPVARVRNVATQAPRLLTGPRGSILIEHEEMITSFTGTTAYTVQYGWACNPGLSGVFAWLSNLATLFEKYRFLELEFIYRTRCPTSVQGSVMGAFDYNAGDSNPETEQIMSTYYGMKDFAPWTTEFRMKMDTSKIKDHRYVRGGSVPTGQDVKTYDSAVFFVASTDFASNGVLAGKWWVRYRVSLQVPQSPPYGTDFPQSGLLGYYTGLSASQPFGTNPTVPLNVTGSFNNNVGLNTGTSIVNATSGSYLYTIDITGTGITATSPNFSVTADGSTYYAISYVLNAAATAATAVVSYVAKNPTSALSMTLAAATTVSSTVVRGAPYGPNWD